MASFFMVGAFFVYLGFLLLAVELCIEPWLVKRSNWVLIGSFAIWMLLLDVFTIGVVLYRPLLKISFATFDGDYPDGSLVGGIRWQTKMSELRMYVVNISDRDYGNVEAIVMSPEHWVRAVAQVNSIPKASVELFSPISTHTRDEEKKHDIPYIIDASGAGFHLICEKLPSRGVIEIIAATSIPRDQEKGSTGIMLRDPTKLSEVPAAMWMDRKKVERLVVQARYTALWRSLVFWQKFDLKPPVVNGMATK
jgi:hypothetical protein